MKTGMGSSAVVMSVPFSFTRGLRWSNSGDGAGRGWATVRAQRAEVMRTRVVFILLTILSALRTSGLLMSVQRVGIWKNYPGIEDESQLELMIIIAVEGIGTLFNLSRTSEPRLWTPTRLSPGLTIAWLFSFFRLAFCITTARKHLEGLR
jgi:hypothetical protein